MTTPRTYPHGVPCWVDSAQEDVDAAAHFYAGLFGWDFHEAMPPGAPGSYRIATLDGQDVGAIGSADHTSGWTTYVAVDDADAVAARVAELGGRLIQAPQDAGPAGRVAQVADVAGARFCLWQAGTRPGAQLVNAPGAWNFSDLHAADPDRANAFYGQLFGWLAEASGIFRLPGYGAHLAATSDPGILERQAGVQAPPGFEDAVARSVPTAAGAQWRVCFTVSDRDGSVATAEGLGATVLSSQDTDWTREAVLRDPQGAVLTLSQFAPG